MSNLTAYKDNSDNLINNYSNVRGQLIDFYN